MSCGLVTDDPTSTEGRPVEVESAEEALTVLEAQGSKGGPYSILGRGVRGFVAVGATNVDPKYLKTFWLVRGNENPRHVTNVVSQWDARAIVEHLYGDVDMSITEDLKDVVVHID